MLGRTDSRTPPRSLLLVVFVVGSLALVAPARRTGRSSSATSSLGEAVAQTTVRLETPSRRGDDLRPDRHGRPGHDRRARPARRGARPADARSSAARPVRELVADPRPRRRRPRPTLRASSPAERAVRRPRPRPRPDASPTGSAAALADEHAHRPVARAGARAGLPAGRRRPGLDAWPPTCSASSTARATASTASSSTTRTTLAGTPRVVVAAARRQPARPMPDDRASSRQPGMPGDGPAPDDRRRPPARASSRSCWPPGSPTRPRASRPSCMDPYTGEIYAEATLPVVRRATTTRRSPRRDPGRFIDPVVSSVYEPGSVFKMMTAAAALETRHGHAARRGSRTSARCGSTSGRTKIDDADRKGMGWMTFEDGDRLLAQRRRGQGRARARQDDPASRRAILYDTWTAARASARRPASTSPARSAGIVRDPAITPWRQIDLANGAFGQGVAVTPIQLATAYAALVNGGTLVQPARRQGDRRPRDSSRRRGGRVIDREAVASTLHRADATTSSTEVAVLPRPDARPGLRRRRQDRHGPDLGREGQQGPRRLEAQPVQLLVRRLHRPRDGPSRTSSSRSGSRRARPTVVRVGQLEMPVMSFELFRRIATDAITTPDLLPDATRSSGDPAPRDR